MIKELREKCQPRPEIIQYCKAHSRLLRAKRLAAIAAG